MSNIPATLFYFSDADELETFHGFDVIQTFQTQAPEPVAVWTVTGYNRFSGQNTALADFHCLGNAYTFCDMCTIVSCK